jgi:hypothetical protein
MVSLLASAARQLRPPDPANVTATKATKAITVAHKDFHHVNRLLLISIFPNPV